MLICRTPLSSYQSLPVSFRTTILGKESPVKAKGRVLVSAFSSVYRGLMKNENRLYAMFACANLYSLAIAGRKLSTD